jgi:putative ABC transport system permease protein
VAVLPERLEERLGRARAAGLVSEGFGLVGEPLRAIYLDGEGRRGYVWLFGAIAALILLVACVNYMNLATARATQRAREVGVRKATGARRIQLVGQFYGEAGVLVAVSLLLGLVGAALLIPAFRAITGKALEVPFADPALWGGLLVVGGLVALVAGSYPALLLSSFRPSQALKGGLRSGRGASAFRQGLVAFQFAVSVFLLVGTAVIFGQLRYTQSADLGFRGEQVIALPTGDRQTLEALSAVKQELLAESGVVAVAAIDRIPGRTPGGYSLHAEGFEVPEGVDYVPLHAIPTEPGVVEALGLDLIAGRDLRTPEGVQPGPGAFEYLVNEAVLRATGWAPEEALGRGFSVSGDGRAGVVVGVFRDYHFLPLHEPIGPLALFPEPDQTNHLLVRLAPADVARTLDRVSAVWQDLVPHRPFTYTFLDASFAAHYEGERRLARLFAAFALLAVLIACLGVLGLAAYAAERRRKEIGVRKVLGARSSQIVTLISREFALLVGVGFLVAAPLAYWAMGRWLEGFAYRVSLGPGVFLLAGGVALALALATVASQALRAARADPVQALRTE